MHDLLIITCAALHATLGMPSYLSLLYFRIVLPYLVDAAAAYKAGHPGPENLVLPKPSSSVVLFIQCSIEK